MTPHHLSKIGKRGSSPQVERDSKALISFLKENGLYLFMHRLVQLPFSTVRNLMLGKKLRAQFFRIGPKSHLRGLSHMRVGIDFSAGQGLWLEAITKYADQTFDPQITIGSHVRISSWSHISCTKSIHIGDHVLIGSKVMITDHSHGDNDSSPDLPPSERPLTTNSMVTIESNVWLGDGVVVCPGVTIGTGSIVGANAIVTKSVSPNTMVAGVPARPIRRYDPLQKEWVRV